MKSVKTFLELTAPLLNDYICVYPSVSDLSKQDLLSLKQAGGALETGTVSTVLLAYSIGMLQDMIYFDTYGKTREELETVFGKCRYIVSSLLEIEAVNSVAKDLVLPGRLETIGIRIIPAEESSVEDVRGISEAQISELTVALRKSDYVAVKGVFIRPNTSSNISSDRLKSYFSLVKDFRSYLPCTLSYFCFEGVIDSLSNDESKQFADNMEIIRSLNDTSLYAQFLIS